MNKNHIELIEGTNIAFQSAQNTIFINALVLFSLLLLNSTHYFHHTVNAPPHPQMCFCFQEKFTLLGRNHFANHYLPSLHDIPWHAKHQQIKVYNLYTSVVHNPLS